jgi:PAS domain S-box-containing protein
VTAVLGYTPGEIEGQSLAALRDLVHPDDQARLIPWDQQWATASDEDHFEIEYRVRHLNGAYRWVHVRERVCTRTDTGVPARILGLATDITAHKQVRDLAGHRHIKRQEIPERLRQFRESLGYTQAEFGRRFGGLNQRQIGSYETGVADPSLDLLLAIHERGYPLSYILGTEREAILDETLHHLTRGYSRQVMIEQLAEVVRGIAVQERETMSRVLRELGLEPTQLTTVQREALEQAARLISRPPEQS